MIVPENLRRDPLSIAVIVSPISSRRTSRVWWEASSSKVHESGSAAPSLGFDKVEGGISYEIGDYKVAIVAKLTRKIDDIDDFVASCKALPVDLRPYDTEVKVSQTALKYLSNNEPELFSKIAKHVTTAPAKTSVTLARKI